MIGSVIVLLGTSIVDAQANNHKPTLNSTGDPESIRIGQSGQKINNVEILVLNTSNTPEKIRLYVDLASIESNGVDTSSVSMSINGIQNGSVINTSQLNTEDTTFLAATIRPNRSSRSIHIDSVQISGINTDEAQLSRNIRYPITVTNKTDFSSTNLTEQKSTSSFQIIDGNIRIHNQATGSTQLHRDFRTAVGVTVDNLSGNTNSTLFITKREHNEIISVQDLRKEVLMSEDSISVDLSNPGGNVTGYLIANSSIDTSDYDIGDYLPTKVTELALSSASGRVVNSYINFNNSSYNEPQTETIVISRAKVSDTINDETPYIISLHPVNSTGHILHDQVIARSRVLTGWSEDIPLNFNTTASQSGIFRSNRYAASIQLALGHSAGNWVSVKKAEPLRNSDLNQQFVSDGVADGGVIIIEWLC
ncbi:hypothetical protein [Halorubrum tropicale]|uniref:hypothetical protein n=1 Tax=Halorubrum tropicale TaxID=1765655 RepID=UPI0011121C9A|nr:hypothetical protein [Halorubrum tropicale]